LDQDLRLMTKIKKNMKNKWMPIMDKVLLRQRAIIETMNDQSKNMLMPLSNRSYPPSSY